MSTRIIVNTPSGQMCGIEATTTSGGAIAYLGVPFATAERFKAPQVITSMDGVFDASQFGPAAPQARNPMLDAMGAPQLETDEAGCLNLNVWTPARDEARRPVVVWVHGGAYVSGSNSSGFSNGAELAAALDVVVVAINYRLGPLGFLALDHLLGEEYADSANLALLDQLAALEWVQANIGSFGGDPAHVTLGGQSAGGAAVATVVGSPLSEGKIRRAIVSSGTAERARTLEQSQQITSEFLAAANFHENEADRLLTLDIDAIIAAMSVVVADHGARVVGLPMPFQPTYGTPALPKLPLDAIREGNNADIDLLTGTALNEGSMFAVPMPGTPPHTASARDRANRVLSEDIGADLAPAYEDALRRELGHDPEDAEMLEAALSDRMYRQPTNRLLEARAEANGRTFAYLFQWKSPAMGGAMGAFHTLDIPFVFRQLTNPEAKMMVGSEPPTRLSDAMSEAWVAFMRDGSPASASLPDWPEFTLNRRQTMMLDETPAMTADPRGELRAIWAEGSTS
ncbi:carboxylesterase/lipase family protein [Demequina aurantiaca]|uniref:carboxylesterase/lipase family protein n=1 Tax=Demequina aurantiaca TaxID=676200 RepID=UPI000AE11041|nr:carboxylesterase family protein [Demequina aurantiaca]